jgi:hypothetical protein
LDFVGEVNLNLAWTANTQNFLWIWLTCKKAVTGIYMLAIFDDHL